MHQYLLEHSDPLDETQRWLIDRTTELGEIARMQIAPEQGAFLTLLTRVLDTRFAVEIGTFTGYSALCIARGLSSGGWLLCCDISEEWTAIAREAWARAGLSDRIELRIGPALETLSALATDTPIDFAFVDADKVNYRAYVEQLIPRLRSGGVIAVDNVLWSGRVLDPGANDGDTEAIRSFNTFARDHPLVDTIMLPIADGLTLLRKR
ncbi:MAG: O-methyltransferase [Acidimicrobiales bacterium]|nr:O-methyltransferase [Acidimicrobiales bacterium]